MRGRDFTRDAPCMLARTYIHTYGLLILRRETKPGAPCIIYPPTRLVYFYACMHSFVHGVLFLSWLWHLGSPAPIREGPAKADFSVLARGRGPATQLPNDRGAAKDPLQRREALEQALHERAQPQRGPASEASRCVACRGRRERSTGGEGGTAAKYVVARAHARVCLFFPSPHSPGVDRVHAVIATVSYPASGACVP